MNIVKKVLIIFVVIVFQGVTFGQGFQFSLKPTEVHAQSASSKTDIVAILVNSTLYPSISGQLDRYTNTYIPRMAPGTTSLIIPVDPNGYDASDIQRILENLYHDGQELTPSQLVGVIMFGELPWPIVELDNKRFISLYPYLDFEDPMFVFDPKQDVFLFNDNPGSLPEVRHSTIPLNDAPLFTKFFTKLEEYFASPTDYATKKIWYDDFPFLKDAFTKEELDRYVNTLLFSESHSYRQVTPTFSRLLSKNYEDELADEIDEGKAVIDGFAADATSSDSVVGNDETENAAQKILGGLESILGKIDANELRESTLESGETPSPPKVLERVGEADFQPIYKVFGDKMVSELKQNLQAGGRYTTEDIDTSLEKIEMADRVSKQFVKDMNEVMADALEAKIRKEDYQLKYPLPYRVSVWDSYREGQCFDLFGTEEYTPGVLEEYFSEYPDAVLNRLFNGPTFQQGPFKGLRILPGPTFITTDMEQTEGRPGYERQRYENFYFGKNAVDIINYEDITIFRGTPYNETSVKRLRAKAYQPTVPVEDITDWTIKKSSIGSSFGMFSQQTQNNKAFNFDRLLNARTVDKPNDYTVPDKDAYDLYKRKRRLSLTEFAEAFWGGASPVNISIDQKNPRAIKMNPFPEEGDEWINYAFNPSVARNIGAPWYDPAGAALTEVTTDEYPVLAPVYKPNEYDHIGHQQYGRMINLRSEVREGKYLRSLGIKYGLAWFAIKTEFIEPSDQDQTNEYSESEFLNYDSIIDYPIKWRMENDYDNWSEERFQFDKEGAIGDVVIQDPLFGEIEVISGPQTDASSFDQTDYFFVYDNVYPGRYPESTWVGITVQPTLGAPQDQDTDDIPDLIDPDKDGDTIPNEEDEDQDGDSIPNIEDIDMDGDGVDNGHDDDTDGDGIDNIDDDDIDGDGIPNGDDDDVDQDFIANVNDTDIDADGVPNALDPDMDGDGIENSQDSDMDGDGQSNGEDTDKDGDDIPDQFDANSGGGGSCNGASSDVDADGVENGSDEDIDGDTLLNQDDRDMDGDGILNKDDGDIDGDGLYNNEDADMDADGLLNTDDPDIDADGIENDQDETPTGIVFIAENGLQHQIVTENCVGQFSDVDEDGIPNISDFDIDNDGIHNGVDPDMDGDGIPNEIDEDIDCDGQENGKDSDCDCDGVANKEDSDVDGDGKENAIDEDIDGDGELNGDDADIDGDGVDNGADSDADGDGVPNGQDDDTDGDGIPNGQDEDVDNDGLANGEDPDTDGDGISNGNDKDQDGDGVVNSEDSDIDGDGIDNASDPDADADGIPDEEDPTTFGYDPTIFASKREDRGDVSCVYEGYDYRYQLIDTLVTHRAGDHDEIDLESTMMTFEKPIDDGRYVSFHGIGGDLVTMYYPDLYNVPIYDCDLSKPEAIEAEIRQYFQEKVIHFNTLLADQQAAAPGHYATHAAAFDFLGSVEPVATPNRTYELMDEQFFVDLIGDENITRIAQHLHYLSTGWTKRPDAATIGEFIDKSRDEFDVNKRFEYIMDEYLNYDDPENEFKFDGIAFPTHIEPKKAYEIGYINSDGADNVDEFDFDELLEEDAGSGEGGGDPELLEPPLPPTPNPPSGDENDPAVDCGYKDGIAVPLLLRPKAFTCWLTSTIENPFEFSLEIEYDFSESLGESYENRLEERGDKAASSIDQFEKLGDVYNTEKEQVEGLVEEFGIIPSVYAQQETSGSLLLQESQAETLNKKTRASYDYIGQDRFDQIDTEVTITAEGNYFSENDREGTLGISARSDVDRVRIRVSAIGEICPEIGGVNLCNRSYTTTLVDPFASPVALPITVAPSSIGVGRLLIEICDKDDDALCYAENIPVVRAAGQLSTINVFLPSDKIVAGSPIPVGVEGLDELGNGVQIPGVYYDMQLVGASFSQTSILTSIQLTDFDDAYYLIYPLDNDPGTISISLIPSDDDAPETLPVKTVEIQMVETSLSVSSSTIDYRLPQRDIGFDYIDEQGRTQLKPEMLPAVEVSLTDTQGGAIVAPLTITTKHGLVRVGVLEDNDGQLLLRDIKETLSKKDTSLQITLLPTGVAGTDEITIQSPGLETITIPVTIKPSGADNLDIDFDYDNAEIGKEIAGIVTITDSRGNSYTELAELELTSRGGLELDQEQLEVSGGEATVKGKIVSGGSCGCGGKATGKNISVEERDTQIEEDETDEQEEIPETEPQPAPSGNDIDPERRDDRTIEGGGSTIPSLESLQENQDTEPSQPSQPSQSGQSTSPSGSSPSSPSGSQPSSQINEPQNEYEQQLCDDQLDNDQDDLIDCEDPDCEDDIFCGGTGTPGQSSGSSGSNGSSDTTGGGTGGNTTGQCSGGTCTPGGTSGTTGGENGSGIDGGRTSGSSTGGSTGLTTGGATGDSSGSGGNTTGGTSGSDSGGGNTSGTSGTNAGDGTSIDPGLDTGVDEATGDSENDGGAGGGLCLDEEYPSGPPAGWYGDAGATYGSSQGNVGSVLRPSDPEEDDINVMYLNLFGDDHGNKVDTVKLLENTKTLAITTYHSLGGTNADRRIIASIIYPDGTVNDKKNIVKELVAEGGDITYFLGYNGGIGKVRIGTWTEFDFMEQGGEFGDKPNKLVYTPVSNSSSFKDGLLTLNDDPVVDFIKGTMHDSIFIRLPEGGGNEWIVTYKNKKIGTFWVYRDTPGLANDTTLYRDDYVVEQRPGGNSSLSDEAVTILLDSEDETGGGKLFESIESSWNPRKNIGFRHEFASLTNFAQGQNVGDATKQYGGLFLVNFGDPFLTRVEESRFVKHTDYDGGVGQTLFSDTNSFQDVDLMDFDNDGKKDMLITYKDGSIRLLKNYGGKTPYKDMGNLIVIPDGIRETYLGDMNGDGRDDILVYTESEKLRAYMNDQGVIDVDGTIVCLDIPNGESNVAQVRQLFATDFDGGGLDIITLDITGDLKVFYGGSSGGGPSYLSTDEFTCDEGRRGRQNQQLLKNFGATLGGPITDYSLRSRGGLQPGGEIELNIPAPSEDALGDVDFENLSKEEIKNFASLIMGNGVDDAKSVGDPEMLLEQAKNKIDYVLEIPGSLLPSDKKQSKEPTYGIRANDLYPDSPRFDVEKSFLDLNGGSLEKGDLVRVSVSLISVGATDMIYWERLDGPWIIYRDEFGGIPSYEGSAGEVDWNVGNGYEFMVHDLNGSTTFSYEVQYDGDGYVHIDIETKEEKLYRGPTEQSVAGVGSPVYAQGGWSQKIRAYADDGCYKQFWEFSPGETQYDVQPFLDEITNEYEDYFNDQRDETEETIVDNTTLGPIEKLIGVKADIVNESLEDWKNTQIQNALAGNGFGRNLSFELDARSYNDYFEDLAANSVERLYQLPVEGVNGLASVLGFENLGLFDDYEFSSNQCGGGSSGKKTCGFGLSIPFNNDLLSPGDFHIFGCKPKAPEIPGFFPHFDGLPILAIPTDNPTWPMRPISPTGAGGITPLDGSTSQVRVYVTMTTSGGMGLSLCVLPYDSVAFPDPIGDLAGNCMVIAGGLPGGQCYGEGEDNNPVLPTELNSGNEQEASDVLTQDHMDLYRTGTCDQQRQDASPIVSGALGGPVYVPGNPKSAQIFQQTEGFSSLQGGESFDLSIEGGIGEGLAQCILRKRVEKQQTYFINNALNMQIDVILPRIDLIAENFENIQDFDASRLVYEFGYDSHEQGSSKSQDLGSASKSFDPRDRNFKRYPLQSTLDLVTNHAQNPFDYIATYFDSVPLVNFEERDVPIQVPFLYREDLERYEFYLRGWLERNKKIANERSRLIAEEPIDVDFVDDMSTAIKAVERNLKILEMYKELPSKIYELLHATDQYVAEVFSFAQQFVGELTSWLQNNANKFSAWVDFIIVLKGIIETRQLLQDVVVKRESKCAKCRQDNYDYYSCKLKFLCVDLPVLPIPPFHLPNVTLDLSAIDIGIDIILPQFRFAPKKVTLPLLPDLPTPRAIEGDLILPEIPSLPMPPPMPELPTLDIQLDIVLPTLPPAPKIPQLSPVIKGVLKLADIVGTFMCIFKGSIGLVRERNIKARVEQMTQRKQDILPFDELQLTIPTSPVEGFDYKIDSLVDIKADFRQLYDIVNGVASDWNGYVEESTQAVRSTIGKVADDIASPEPFEDLPGAGFIDDIGIETDFEIDLSGTVGAIIEQIGDNRPTDEQLAAIIHSKRSSLYVGGEPEKVRESLLEGLEYIRNREDLSLYHEQAEAVAIALIDKPLVTANVAGIEQLGDEMSTYLIEQRELLGEQKDLIQKDYDVFLDTLQVFSNVANTNTDRTFAAPLYNTDAVTQKRIAGQEHPLKTYLTMNKRVVDGYTAAVEKNSPIDLQMNELRYDEMRGYLGGLGDRIDTILDSGVLDGKTPTNTVAVNAPRESLLTQSGGSGGGSSEVDPKLKIDFTQFMNGFFVPGKDKNYHNVIALKETGNEWYRGNAFEVDDLNGDGSNEIINYTENQIFVKYGKQLDGFGPGISGSYVIGPFASAEILLKAVKETAGRYDAGGATFKIRDDYPSVYTYDRSGQSFDAMAFGWEQDPHLAGYVIEVAERVDTLQEKSNPSAIKYILALPSSVEYDNSALEIYGQLKRKSINAYIQSGVIVDVLYYDSTQERVDALLRELDRKRQYTKISPLRLEKFTTGSGWIKSLVGKQDPEYVYRKIGPRGHQRIAGVQKRADDQRPVVTLELIRDLTGETVSQGQYPQGVVNTTYTLKGIWNDNGKVLKNWIMYDGQVIQLEEGEEIELKDLDYKYPIEEPFVFGAIDQAGNVAQQEVSLTIIVPEFEIEDIQYLGAGAEVITKLSDTVDRGQVKFETNRFGYWKPLNPDTYPTKPLDPIVKGGLYVFDSEVVFEDQAGNELGSLDTQTGELSVNSSLSEGSDGSGSGAGSATAGGAGGQGDGEGGTGGSVGAPASGTPAGVQDPEIIIDFSENGRTQAQIRATDPITEEQYVVFSIGYNGQQLVEENPIELLDDAWVVYGLDSSYGDFAQGYCLAPVDSECQVYITKEGDISIPEPYRYTIMGDYTFENGAVGIILSELGADPFAVVRFISTSFE